MTGFAPAFVIRRLLLAAAPLTLALGVAGWIALDRSAAPDARSDAPPPVRESPARVAALLPFAADQLTEMGSPPVAVPDLRGPPPAAWAGLPRVAMNHASGPNIEQLVAAAPDVVILSHVYAQFAPQIESITGARVVLMDVESLEDVERHLRTLGDLADRSQRAEEMIEALPARTASPAGESVRTLAIFGTPHAFYAFLPDSYLGELIERAGGRLVTGGLQAHRVFRGMAPFSMEAAMDADPDLLIVVFHGPEESARAMLADNPLWANLRAVQSGQVAFLRDDLYAMRPGSELRRAAKEIEAIVENTSAGRP